MKRGSRLFFWTIIIFLFILVIIIFGIVIFKSKSKSGNQPTSLPPLKTVVLEPTAKHTNTFIFLHGLGDRAENWQAILRPIAQNYPHFRFIFPQALWLFVSMNRGMPMPAWYNIKGDIRDILNLKQDKEGVLRSVRQIEKIIQQEVDSGIKPAKIMVGGYSQGGSVALAVGLTTQRKLGKILCLSGFLPCREEIFSWVKEKNNSLPFCFYHNSYDNLVPCEVGRKSAQMLKERGWWVNFEEKRIEGGHIWPEEEIRKVVEKNLFEV